ncbi:DUF624 domain-containing protein [Halobacillus salinarum]|uniref:DUF624 domain-containing protein n=1 Tax=Halobacillus salinarum TaxID=2932257 RepID=A0ABY4EH47_9BACI|nr:DUF624 domain-containing protein [Halobacillus salinarum]UOQ43203.1 DUF624 domain-containing protein [Halobacillus salinarum]
MNEKIVNSLDLLLTWVVRLAAVNLLWIGFTLGGLVVVGIFPSTVAALGVSRKWIMGETEIRVWETFRKIYQEEFASANKLGWLLFLTGGLLFLNYKMLQNANGQIVLFIPIAFYLLVFIYFLAVLWSFPLLTHFKGGVLNHIKNALIIGFSKLPISLMQIVLLFGLAYVSLLYPSVIPFFTFSVCSFLWMWQSVHVFKKLEVKLQKT